MTSDETWQAYNDWGGYSFYTGTATGSPWCCSAQNPGRAVQVSYNRPFATRYDSISPDGQDFFFYAEFPMIQFLEKNGYDVSYVSQIDVAQPGAPSMIEQHKVLMNTGHSEYWDAQDMSNITAARNAGVNLAFFTGNTAWWKTRWANSQFGNEPYRTLITYKESLDSTESDPADPPTWTGAWRDQRFSPPGDASPENALTGQLCGLSTAVPMRIRCRPLTPSCRSGKIRRWPACRPARRTRCRTRRSAMSGTPMSTTGSAQLARSTCRRRARTPSSSSADRHRGIRQ